jgi:hypothetical protein
MTSAMFNDFPEIIAGFAARLKREVAGEGEIYRC